MEQLLLAGAALTLLLWVGFAWDLAMGRPRVPDLAAISPTLPVDELPRLSVVVAARNEEDRLEEAIQSMLKMDYPQLEVIAVNDRSTDQTGAILDRLAESDRRLETVHVETLPKGWLGKNHALETGAARANGALLLFTDADVQFEPSTLKRAVQLMLDRNVDHLAAACDIHSPSRGVELFVSTFALFFNGYARPWRASDPKSKAAVGIGAFNLVRRTAYDRAGRHQSLRMAADDDMQLGRRLKASGARQMFALATSLVGVEWYPTLGAAVRGLEKNSLAAVNYSFGLLAAGGAVQIVFATWPFVAVFVATGTAQLLYLASVATIVGCHVFLIRSLSVGFWTAAALPIGALLVVFTIFRAGVLAKIRGGIFWRGTFYTLEELKKNRPVN